MANPFDQFDTPAASPPANPFDQFDNHPDDWQPVSSSTPASGAGGVDDWQPVHGTAPVPPSATAKRPVTANPFADLIPAGGGAGPTAPQASANPFADLIPSSGPTPAASAADPNATPQGPLSNAGDESWTSGFLKGAGTAAVRGASMVAGLPGDLDNLSKMGVAGVDRLVRGGSYADALARVNAAQANAAAGAKADGVPTVPSAPDSQTVEGRIENATGSGRYDPSTAVGRVAQAAGSAIIGGAVNPGAAAEGATAGSLLNASKGAIAANAASGAGSQAALEATQAAGGGDGAQTGAALTGGLVGALTGHAMSSMAGRYTSAGRDVAVGADLLRSSSDPKAVKAALSSDAPASIVPGSTPTTAELTGDAGLSVLQDRAATADPASFNTREDANNSARIAALQSTAPADADAMAPATTFADRLDAIQSAGQQVRDEMTAAHADAVSQLNSQYADDAAARSQAGADFADQQRSDLADRVADRQSDLDADTAAQAGQTASSRDALTQAFADRLQAAQSAADAGNATLGPSIAPEVAGQVLRDHLQAASDQERAATNALYKAVDPDGSLYAVATPVKSAVADIRSSIDPYAGVQPSGVEADLHSSIAALPDVVPFRSLQALDSRVGAAMADARRNPSAADPQALGRLTQLKSATLDAINGAVDHQQSYEASQVANGTLSQNDTVAARLGNAPATAPAEAPSTGARPAAPMAGNAPASTGTPISDMLKSTGGIQDPQGALAARGLDDVVAKPGQGLGANAARQVAEQSGLLPKGSTVSDLHDALAAEQGAASASTPRPNMDAGVADRLAAAKAQAQVSAAYKSGPVGEALKSSGYKGSYKMAPEGVARAATRDYTSAKAFIDRAKGAPEAVGQMGEVVTNDLRRRVGPSGEIAPTALSAWETQNAGALRAIRETQPEFGKGFSTAAKANDALVQLGQERAATLKAFELDAAARGADSFTAGRNGMRTANAADKAATARTIADRRTADLSADAAARAARDAGIAQSKATTGNAVKVADDVLAQARKLPGAELATKTDPSEVARFMGKLVEDKTSGPTRARQFMASIAGDDAAVAGARKALVDHVVGRLENGAVTSAGDRALSGPKLRTYLADHAAALQAVMPKEHLDAWNAVAADMARRDASRAAARTTNSATASRLLPAIEKAAKAAGHGGGHAAGGAAWILALDAMMEHGISWHSAGLAAAPYALGMARKAVAGTLGRERNIRANLLTEALLNPDVARHYVRALGHANPSAGAALVNTLRRGFTGLQAVR